MPDSPGEISRLLVRWRGGDDRALDELVPLVYEELRRLASRAMSGERRDGHALQTTAIVHEAYVRLVDADIPWGDRVHFYSVAVRMMRRILVDHARAERSAKRGGSERPVTLGEDLAVGASIPLADFLDLDAALDRLALHDERKSRAIQLRYFAGLDSEEIAPILGVPASTVRSDLRLARAWLLKELTRERPF